MKIKKLTKLDVAFYEMNPVQRVAAGATLRAFFAHDRPVGTRDNADRFYPAERCPHCVDVRSPSKSWPNSLWHHAKSLPHRAHVAGTTPEAVRTVRAWITKNRSELLEGDRKLMADFLHSAQHDYLSSMAATNESGREVVARPSKRI